MQLASRLSSVGPRSSRVALFRVLSEASRLKVLALCVEEELSVSELALLLRDSQPQVSRKVGVLREAGLLEARREGTRTFVRAAREALSDAVVAEAVAEGRRLCLADGSLARIPSVVAAREDVGLSHFEAPMAVTATSVPASLEHLAHLSALSPLLGGRQLAIDVGTGDGLTLDVLAPLYSRVIAVERSRAQLARVAERIASRGFHNVSLFPGSYDDAALLERVDRAGGADLVFVARTLHHASRPAQAVAALARLLKRGGFLVVLDYLPHEDDRLRTEAGDVWLGFSVADVRGFLSGAGLTVTEDVPIPDAFHPQGADAGLSWHAWAARRPLPSLASPTQSPLTAIPS